MYAATVRSRTSNCPTLEETLAIKWISSFTLPFIYQPHHHLTIPDGTTANAAQVPSHELMSVCSSDARQFLRSKQTRLSSILPADESRLSLCSPWSRPGTLASLRAHTAVTFSGIILDPAILIDIPGKIRRAQWKSVSSVRCVSRQPTRRAVLVVVRLSCRQQRKHVHLFTVSVQK